MCRMKAVAAILIFLSLMVTSVSATANGQSAESRIGITKTQPAFEALPVLMLDAAQLDLASMRAWSQSVGAELLHTHVPGKNGDLDAALFVVSYE